VTQQNLWLSNMTGLTQTKHYVIPKPWSYV